MGTEERRIQSVLQVLGRYPATPLSGIRATAGVEALDDCAVIPIGNGLDLIAGSDFVRGEGFLLYKQGLLSRKDVGYYLIGANTSDLAAMGASPVGVLVVVRYTDALTDVEFVEIMEGVAQACQDFGIPLLGGDSGGYDAPVLSAAAFGVCERGKALFRAKGRSGDRLFLSGTVGTAGAAYMYFCSDRPSDSELSPDVLRSLLAPWKRVSPALAQGRLLVEKSLSHCAIDTSDGLKTSCRHIASASSIDIILHEPSIPIGPGVREVAEVLGIDAVALACSDSVDFRLLFSSPQDRVSMLKEEFAANGFPLFEIGELRDTNGSPQIFLDTNGKLSPLRGIERD